MQEEDRQELKKLLSELRTVHRLSPKAVLRFLSTDKVMLPSGIYRQRELAIMEATVKYLHENKGMGLSQIAKALGRDARSVWSAYHRAKSKVPAKLEQEGILIPLYVFQEQGTLKPIVSYLRHAHGLKFREIGEVLGRDTALVCAVYNRK